MNILFYEELQDEVMELQSLAIKIQNYLNSGSIDVLGEAYKDVTESRKVIGTALSSQKRANLKALKAQEKLQLTEALND